MVTYLKDILDLDLLQANIENGYVRSQVHPYDPFIIYNYTEKAQYEDEWNWATSLCRGLIVNYSTGEVVARPFHKFFNYEQRAEYFMSLLDEPVYALDKLDGSLGILYRDTDGLVSVATRGSFTSDQAKHATQIMRTRYKHFEWPEGVETPLVEIIYPDNRIVCDYGNTDDLFLLGFVNNETGKYTNQVIAGMGWPGPIVDTIGSGTLRQVLSWSDREGKEGMVIHFPHKGEMCKIKQQDYVELHRIIFGLSEKMVWEMLGEGKSAEQICEALPDEFHKWVDETSKRILKKYYGKLLHIDIEYRKHVEGMQLYYGENWSRKEFALKAKDSPNAGYLFALLDGKDIEAKVWQSIKPVGDTRIFHGQSEDTA